MSRKFGRVMALAGALVALAAIPAHAFPDQYHPAMERVNNLILIHDYPGAEAVLDSLQRLYPDSTDIRFQEVVLYYTWIDDYGIADSLGGLFMGDVDTTIMFSNRDTDRNPDDKWAWFFKGSAYAYRCLFNSAVKGINLGTIAGLLSDASTGMSDLERAASIDTSFADPDIGIGKYLHWKSRKFPWPFASAKDGRRGIKLLEKAVSHGTESGGGAVQVLGWVYMSEHRYDDVIKLVEPWAERYPSSRFFAELLARAYQEKGDYTIADSLFECLVEGLTPMERASNFMVMKYVRWIAALYLEEGHPAAACAIARHLKSLDYTGVHPDWLRRKMDEVNKVYDKACSGKGGSADSDDYD